MPTNRRTPEPIAVLDARERSILTEGARIIDLEVGEVLFREGDLGDSMYVIDEGVIELHFRKARSQRTCVPGNSSAKFRSWLAEAIGRQPPRHVRRVASRRSGPRQRRV